MRLVVLQHGHELGEVEAGSEAIYIGSGEDCAIRLPDGGLPLEAVMIFATSDDAWSVECLAEGIPCELNGNALVARQRLRAGDQIKIAEFLIRAESLVAPAPQDAAQPAEDRPRRVNIANLNRFVQFRLPAGTLLKKAEEPISIALSQRRSAVAANLRLAAAETVEQWMDPAVSVLFEMFGAQRVWLGVRKLNYGAMDYVEGRFSNGKPAELPETGESLKPRVLDRGQFIALSQGDEAGLSSVLTGPLAGPDGTLGMVFLDSGDTGRRYGEEELDGFIMLMTAIAGQLDAIFNQQAKTRAAMLEGQVAVAHAIQTRLTPRMLPQWEQLQFGAFRELGRERTSDHYDVVRIPNGMAGVLVAHTTAIGPLPGMVMSQVQAAFRMATMYKAGPQVFLRSVNALSYDGERDHPLDCFMAIIDPDSGEMRWSVAGNVGAYIISNRGEERPLAPPTPNPSIAHDKATVYEQYGEKLGDGETLVIFTPGVVTAKNSKGEVFGEERFVNIIADGFGQLASATLKEMLHDLRQFTEGGAQPDDITVMLAHRT